MSDNRDQSSREITKAGRWLYTTSRAIRSMGAAPGPWTRHYFVGKRSACGSVILGRLQPGQIEPGQGESRECKRCRKPSTKPPTEDRS